MLENLKKEVLEVAKRAQREGLCKHRSGNFSAIDRDSGYIVVTPAGCDREELSVRDMIVVDMRANVIENLSNLKPTSEVLMHIKVYETRPDAQAIVHTHSPYATSFAILEKPIPAIVYEIFTLGLSKGRIPVAPYGRPGTEELADSVIEVCKEAECFLMARHGAVAFDARNIYEAYLKASYIEELAKMYHIVLTMNHNQDPKLFDQQELDSWKYPTQVKL